MNHIYKVIWNKAKHCYTVVSEIAKSHSDSTKRVRMGTTAALMAVAVLTGFAMPAQAAVSIGTDGTVKAEAADINALNDLLKNGVTNNKDGSVTVGGLTVKKNGEVSSKSQHIVYGKGAQIKSDITQSQAMGFISIGNNATAWIGGGGQERSFAYDGKAEHAAGAIAIGSNTFARTGSIMIGSHEYKGNMGDVKDIDTDVFNTGENGAYGHTVNSTTIGTNSFTKGSLATTIGDYNIQSGKSMGYNDWVHGNPSSFIYGAQNFGATVLGALNSNESQSATISGYGTSGVANSIVGVANRVNSSNGTLVFGAGNEVTNSLSYVSGASDSTALRDAKNAQDTFKDAVAKSDGGGAVLAIGGANKADWAQKSQLVGVGNTLTGTSNAVSMYDMINGYKNEVTNATNTSIIGSNNKAKDTKSTTVTGDNNDVTGSGNHIIGDNHKVTGANNIIVGNNKEQKTHTGHDSVIIGNNASAGTDSLVMGNKAHAGNTGIALGMNASAGDGQNLAIGYYANVSGAKNSTALGYASKVEKRDILSSDGNDGVVSVGKSVGQSGEAGITRRIINVKAGVKDTDAVNVSQLKGVNAEALKHSTVTNGDANITVTEGFNKDGGKEYKVALNNDITLAGDDPDAFVSISGSKGTIWTSGSVTAGSVAVGTAKADGTTPFFVDSKGAFYAANGKLVVDKDGKVTATEGEIGNVVLKNGVLYKNTALRDGELYVGDVDGNYSQITTKGAKLGKVTVAVDGKISGVAAGAVTADSTDAVNGSQLHAVATEAGKHSKVVSGNNINVEETDVDGQKFYKVNMNKDIMLGDLTGKNVSISGTNGTIEATGAIATKDKIYADKGAKLADIDIKGDTISNGQSSVKLDKEGTVTINGKVNVDKAGQIHNVTAGTADEDAVNVSQLKKQAAASKTTVSDGINTTVTSTVAEDGHTDYKVNLNKDLTGIESMTNGLSSIRMGNGGTVTINNRVTIDQSGKISGVAAGEVKEGSTDAVNGSQLKGVENKADKNAENIQKNTDAIAKNTDAIVKNTADISKNAEAISQNTENIQKNSEAIAENAKNIQKNTEAIAKNTEDISKNTEAIGKLDERVTSVEEVAKKHTTVSTDDKNVQISEDTNKDGGKDYKVSLNKDLNLSSVTTGDTKMDTNGVTVKDVSLTKDGLSIGNKTYVSDKGLNANDQKVTNVAAGDISEKSTDAVNGSQLFATNQQVAQNAQSISKLGNRINKVGAGAAALAALHPLDFDPDDKWDFAAGYGNYNGENAAAIGAYYRPNEDTMFSVGGSFGNGENMVNAGVSLKLGQGNHVSTSKVAMAKEIKDLRKEMEGLKSALLDANAGKKLDTSKLQLFPDVPKNHWAYEYVSTLKGNGVLTGYPDGEFKGDRPMTRYEFATMLYKAMLEGATLSDRILKEFAPELERFTVDTVHQDKDGKPTVERVRTVKAAK